MTRELPDHYKAVLNDLQQRRAAYVNAIEELDAMIAGILRLQAINGAIPVPASPPSPLAPNVQELTNDATKYSGMSVRWATLNLLAEDSTGPLTTAEIAEALQARGVKSSGQRFGSIVSAVVSDMRAKKSELEVVEDGRYQLTKTGHDAWEHIKMTPQYRSRALSGARQAVAAP